MNITILDIKENLKERIDACNDRFLTSKTENSRIRWKEREIAYSRILQYIIDNEETEDNKDNK